MNSFYLSGAGRVGDAAWLLPEEAKHAFQVLRLRPGEEICAVDDRGQRFLAAIGEINRERCSARLLEELPSNESSLRLTLYQGLPKGDKLDMIAQKLTELGAAALVPVQMERSVVKLDARDGQKRLERLRRIAREAAKQCKRARAPEISPPQRLNQLSQRMMNHELLLVPWEDAAATGMRDVQARCAEARDVGIVIGPEGGMSAAEVEMLQRLGAWPVRLGPRILRTETAAVAACAMAMLLWGDMG